MQIGRKRASLDLKTHVGTMDENDVGISPKQFEHMQQRLAARRPAAVLQPIVPKKAQIVLGVDPSLRGTGYGIIGSGQVLAQGTIRCSAGWERSRCLVRISERLRDVIKQHRPEVCVMEGLFYAQNLQTALIMGEARGASIAAVAEAGLEIYEIAARKVKQAIVGYGAAQKLAVAKMVQRMLRLPEPPAPDAADALALALAYVQQTGRFSLTPPKKI